MQKSDISFLKQLVKSLEDAESKLEESFKERDSEEFNGIKSFMLKIQKQIAETIE